MLLLSTAYPKADTMKYAIRGYFPWQIPEITPDEDRSASGKLSDAVQAYAFKRHPGELLVSSALYGKP